MRCPYLAKDVIYFCTSEYSAVVCTCSRLKKYCKTDSYKGCPRFAVPDGSGDAVAYIG